MKRYISLLLALVMVVGLIPATAVLATEENTTPALVDENFDDIALEFPSVDSIPGVDAYTAAQIKSAPDRTGCALWVGDEEQTVVPSLQYGFESTSNVTVEFDVNVSDQNALNVLRIYNDNCNSFPKVAISLNFSSQGLRYFKGIVDGTNQWSAYDASVKLPVNDWATIRIELIPGKSGEAKIYVDDVNVLTIPGSEILGTMANDANSVNGIYFASNKAERSFYVDNLKITPAPYRATYEPTKATNFEAMELDAAPGDPIINVSQATVVSVPFGEGTTNAVQLNDKSATALAGMGITVEDSASLKLSFKYMAGEGALQLWITYGGRSTANTAYLVQFNGTNVQYNDGTGVKQIKNLGANLTSWTDITIEADINSAKVYVKGTLVGEAQRAGGSYGTNVSDKLNSVFFTMGSGSKATDYNCYVDDLSLSGNTREVPATPAVSCDFESMEVGAALGDPAVDVVQATVISRVNGTGRKAVQLEDAEEKPMSIVRFPLPEKTDKMVAEFDLVAWVGAMEFYITNGAKTQNNSAYMLKIQAKNIQYYNGTGWVPAKTMDNALSGWNKIRIEADLESADLYINGVLMCTAQRSSSESYGKNVTDGFDSLVFISGTTSPNTGTNNPKYIIDNVNLTDMNSVMVIPDVIEEDFDAYYARASVDNVENIVESTAAAIVADPAREGNAVLLHDVTGVDFGEFDYAYDLVDSYILEYEAFIPTSANDVSMQILAGRGDNRTAYVLTFNRAYGLRVLTGRHDTGNTWVNLDETKTKPTPNEWNKIRVEVNTGEEQSASIYLNDQLIATTTEAYYRANDLVGAYIYAGGKNQNVYIDNLKVTVVEPEEESIEGIVKTENGLMLEKDVTVDSLTVKHDTTLDLNGHTLTVTNLACFGTIIDSSEWVDGLLIAENMELSNMTYMPIYDADWGGYKFFAYELKNLGIRETADGSVVYGFSIDFANIYAYTLLANGAEPGVDVTMDLAWGEDSQKFAFDAELLQQYASLQIENNSLTAALMLTVSGLGDLELGTEVSVTPAVAAASQSVSGDAMVYTVS